jgi:DNA polymerase elongation subunit (family B)
MKALQRARQRMMSSWSLEYVSQKTLKVGRVHVNGKFSDLSSKEIEERCLRDVQLTLEIDKKLGISDSCIARASFSHILPDDAIYAGSCVDGRQLRAARDLGYVLETKPKHVKEHSGALVLQPPKPFIIYKEIAVFDFSSLYPSIIISKRISPDKEHKLFPLILETLKVARLAWKGKAQAVGKKESYENTMQDAYKVVLNATYGYLSKRVHKYNLGDEVAITGRRILRHIMDSTAKSYSLKTVYGDTDSLFLEFPHFTEERSIEVEEAITGEVKDHFDIDVDSECSELFSKLYFPKIAAGERAAKKHYAGKVAWKRGIGKLESEELEIVGLEAIRSDTPEAFRGLQSTLLL